MALTEHNITSTGATTYPFTFPYLKPTDVKVDVNGIVKTYLTHWEFDTPTTIKFKTNNVPPANDLIRIYRDTDDSKLEAQFFAGSAIKSSDLNDNFTQNLYVTQESNNKIDAAWTSGTETIISSETWVSADNRVSSTAAQDARIDSKIDTALTTDVAAGNKITVTDNSPGSGQITVGVTPASLVNSDINASAAIAGTKIDPQFGTQNVSLTGNITVSGTVDGRDVSVDGTKLDTCDTGAKDDQTAAEIRVLVESATDSNVFTDTDHTRLNAIEDNATRDQTDAEIRTAVDAASDSNVFTDADHTKLDGIDTGAKDDQTAAEIKTLIASSPLDDSHLAANSVGDSEIVTGALDNRYYTESELLTGGVLDGRYFTETESDARYFNISSGDTIKDGDTFPDNDTTIATTAAINDRIIDLVDDVGGFVPIANETSFPNANPDVNNGAGTLISIKALSSNITSNGSGVATVANGTVGNSTVTITGLANSTTYSTSYGMIVETTTTLNTYTFHRQVPIATEVSTVASNIANVNAVGNNISNVNTVAGNTTNINTVSGANTNITTVSGSIANVNTVATNITNVNDFSDKYRVASSAPSSNNDTGDLYYDTSSNELRVYNGSAWQGGVTATGNLASLGANTFTGAQTFVSGQAFDGRDVSVDGAKLDGIEAGATGDQTNTEIRTAVEAASDSNVFTDADHTKLNAIEAGATGDQTNVEIRAAVEAATDSNVFTDADHTKLNAIEAGATADQSASELLTAIKTVDGSGSGLDADLLDGVSSGSFLRSDADDSMSGVLNLTSSTEQKLVLSGSSNPTIRLQEGTTNKVQIQWDSSSGLVYFWNDEHNRGFQLGSTPKWYDGSTYKTIWHQGNDGAGSGLDADTLDGVQGSSFLRSDTSDEFTSGRLTIHGMGLESSGVGQNLKFRRTTSGADMGLTFYDGSNNWRMQLYATLNYYGFLYSNWGSWDIKKNVNGPFEVNEGAGLQRVLNAGNVGSGGALSSVTPYVASLWSANWVNFSSNDGLYWGGGSGSGWHIWPESNSQMSFRSGNSSDATLALKTNNNIRRGCVYANSSDDIGLLNQAGSWSLRCATDKQTFFYNTIKPNTNAGQNIGSSSHKWNAVYATTFHGDGSNITNLPAGGASFTATADGALAANKAVYIKSNGQVKQIEVMTVPNNTNNNVSDNGSTYVRSGKNDGAQMTYDNTHDKIVICDVGYEVACLHVNSSGSLTSNNTYTNLNHSSSTTMEDLSWGIYSPDNGLVLQMLGGYGAGVIRVIEPTSASGVSGNGMNISSAHTFSSSNGSAYFLNGCYDENVNKAIICYADKSDSYKGYIRTVSVSGTNSSASVSYGSSTIFRSADVRYCRMAYDSNANRSYLVYQIGTQIYYRYVTVSGTNISLGSEQTLATATRSATYEAGLRIAYGSTDNNVVVCWPGGTSGWRPWRAIAGTPGSSSISWGSESNVSGQTETYMNGDMVWEGKSNHYFCSFRTYPGGGSTNRMDRFIVGSNNSLSTAGSWNDGWYWQDKVLLCAVPKNNTYLLDGWVYLSSNNYNASNGYVMRFKTSSSTSNLPGPNYFVGFPKQAYSSGQTATIQTYGSVVEGFSGLKPGWPYFVKASGIIGDSPESSSFWPVGDGYTWDTANNQRHPDAENSWNPNASNATQSAQFTNTPLAGLAVGTDKLLMTTNVMHRQPYSTYSNSSHNHGG